MKTLLILALTFLTSISFAETCFEKKKPLENNESELLKYRDFMEKGFKTRGHVDGLVVEQTENRQGHLHFILDLDSDLTTSDDHLEIIYNQQYGEIAEVLPGSRVRACGDFIVDHYSPTKAVLHWLHLNPNKKKNHHEDGFLIIDNQVFGLQAK